MTGLSSGEDFQQQQPFQLNARVWQKAKEISDNSRQHRKHSAQHRVDRNTTDKINKLLTIFQTSSRVQCVSSTASRHTGRWSSARNWTRRNATRHTTSQTTSPSLPLKTQTTAQKKRITHSTQVLGIRSFPGWLLSRMVFFLERRFLDGRFLDSHFPGKTIPGKTIPGWSLSRKDVSRVVIFPDETFPRKDYSWKA